MREQRVASGTRDRGMNDNDSDGNCLILCHLPTATFSITNPSISFSCPHHRYPPINGSETPSFPDGERGLGLSSEPAFAWGQSSDGTRGRDDETRLRAISSQLSSGYLTIAQALFQPQSRELLLVLIWFQGVDAGNHVLHTPSRDSVHVHRELQLSVVVVLHHRQHHRGPSSSFPAMR